MRRKLGAVRILALCLICLFSFPAIAPAEENEDKSSADYDVSWVTEHKFSGRAVTPIPDSLRGVDTRGGTVVDVGGHDFDFSKPGITYGTNRNIAQLKWVDLGDGTGCYQYKVEGNNLYSQSIYSTSFVTIKPNRNYLISVLLWSDFSRLNAAGNTCEGIVDVIVGNKEQRGGVDMRRGISDNTNGWTRFEYVASTGLMETAVSGRIMFQTWQFNPGMPEGNIYIGDITVVELPEVTDVPVYAEGEGVTFRGGAGDLDMKLVSAEENDELITVCSTGAEYVFNKKEATITASQRIGLKLKISSWRSSIPFDDLTIKSKTEKECVISCPEVTFGVQLDGMLFLTPHKQNIGLTCTSEIAGIWNKFAFGFLTVADDYGGFTVTPDLPEGTGKLCDYKILTENLDFTQTTFDNSLGLYNGNENPYLSQVSNAKVGWQIAWTISPGERLAISTFPPREYDWEKSFEMTYRNMDWNSSMSQYVDDYNDFDVRAIVMFNAADRGYATEWGPHWTYNAPGRETAFKEHITAGKAAGMKMLTYAPAYFYFDKSSPDRYITEVARLKNRYGLDGIYSDGTPSEHQWVTAYEESRMLRELFPDGVLIVHQTGVPANGGPPLSSAAHFIPAVDTYWNATLKAETVGMRGITSPTARYTLSQYNAANVVGITKGDAWNYVDSEGKNQVIPQADRDLIILEKNGRARITMHDATFKTNYVSALRTLKSLWKEKGSDPNFYDKYYAPKVRELTRDKLKKYGDIVEFSSDFSKEEALEEFGIYNTRAEIRTESDEAYLELRGQKSYESGSILKRMVSVSGPMSIEYRFKVKERGNFAHSISDNYDNPGIELMFGEDGKIKLKNIAGNYVDISTYKRDKWYNVKLEINTDQKSYDLYINGRRIKKNVALDENVYQFSELEFTDGGYGSVCCLEGVKVLNKW